MTLLKICQTCALKNNYICAIKNYRHKAIDCPCAQCLIKSMCNNMCDERKEFWRFNIDEYHFEKQNAYSGE